MDSVFSLQNSVSLCIASFCSQWPKLPVSLGSLDFRFFAFQSTIYERASFYFFFLMLVLEDVIGLY